MTPRGWTRRGLILVALAAVIAETLFCAAFHGDRHEEALAPCAHERTAAETGHPAAAEVGTSCIRHEPLPCTHCAAEHPAWSSGRQTAFKVPPPAATVAPVAVEPPGPGRRPGIRPPLLAPPQDALLRSTVLLI